MDTDVMLTIGTILVGIITAIMVSVIPWAHRVTSRLTRIETQLKLFSTHGPDEVRAILRRIEQKMAKE